LRVQQLRGAADVLLVHGQQAAVAAVAVGYIGRRVQAKPENAVMVVACAAAVVEFAAVANLFRHSRAEGVAGSLNHSG